MARVGRLAGAILAETDETYYLVGNTKTPCDFRAHGFTPPERVDAVARPYLALERAGTIALRGPWLRVELEGEALARTLAERLLIERNGSVSERLWRLVTGAEEGEEPSSLEPFDARWLCEVPAPIWRVVRDTVLRCS